MNEIVQSEIPWYWVDNIEQTDTPALLFYPERIKENISILKSFIGDVNRLRPHVKTHKSIEITKLMLDAGITKFKCATIAEAEMLGISNAPDVLLAYQPVLSKVHRFIRLIKTFGNTQFACLVDNADSAEMISAEAQTAGVNIAVFIDVNIGMNRTGVLPVHVLKLYEFCSQQTGITVKGLHAYDGHINIPDLNERTIACKTSFEAIEELIKEIQIRGYNKPVIIAGGTPTFPVFAKMDDIECSPGTFILWDEGYRPLFPDLPFLPAALVATRVISALDPQTFCLDVGHKAISAENALDKRIKFLNARSVQFVSHSEEHLVIKSDLNNQLEIGDVLYGLPVHICPTCALYDYANIVIDNEIVDEWKIQARSRKISI